MSKKDTKELVLNKIRELADLKRLELFGGKYTLYSNGDVYSKKHKKFIKPYKQPQGYLMHDLYDENKQKQRFLLHRLVGQSFIPNPENKREINHKNGNKHDNRVENLEWVTSSENRIHGYKVLGIESGMKGRKLLDGVFVKL